MEVRLLFLLATLSACAASIPYQAVNSDTVKTATLNHAIDDGSFDVYLCPALNADGYLEYRNRKIAFCLEESGEHSIARIHTAADRRQICFWRDTGTCDENGVCESWAIADDCIDLGRSD